MQHETKSGPAISVVICTYNRAELLADALRSVCEQTIDRCGYEVIVVDNNSKDNTRHVAKDFCRRYPNVRYCLETQQGLSHARNLGWQEAKGEYVAYMDDDCKVPDQWLAVAQDIIAQISPGAFGGPIRPYFRTTKPRWVKASFGTHQPFNEARLLNTENECTRIFGGNAFFRRIYLQKLGGFDPNLGMSGQKVSYGEESALLKMMRTTMPNEPIYYDPELYVYHLVKPETMTWRYNLPASFEAGRIKFLQHRRKIPHPDGRREILWNSVRTLLALTFDVLRSVLHRDRTQYPYVQTYLYEHTLEYVRRLGWLYAQFESVGRR